MMDFLKQLQEATARRKPFNGGEKVVSQPIDPDNPPLTGKEVWGSGREQILKRIAAHKAKTQNGKR